MSEKDNPPPVIVHIIVIDGNPIEVPYAGTLDDMARNYVRSLPQNRDVSQGKQPPLTNTETEG